MRLDANLIERIALCGKKCLSLHSRLPLLLYQYCCPFGQRRCIQTKRLRQLCVGAGLDKPQLSVWGCSIDCIDLVRVNLPMPQKREFAEFSKQRTVILLCKQDRHIALGK